MNFGEAIEALKQGKCIQRAGWNGKGLFVVKESPVHIEREVIPLMIELPKSAKDILMSREEPHIDYTNQMLIVNPDGRADSWVPSVSDVFAEDWYVYGDNTPDWKQRLIKEHDELEDKYHKLMDSLKKEGFDKVVGLIQYDLLMKQATSMFSYLTILKTRMKDLGIKVN